MCISMHGEMLVSSKEAPRHLMYMHLPHWPVTLAMAAVCKQGTGCSGSALTYLCSMMGVEPVQQLCLLAFAV